RAEQSSEGPEVSRDFGEIPPADRLEFGLAVNQRVDAFDPVRLRRFAPLLVPARGFGARTHALGIQTGLRSGGDLGDVQPAVEDLEAVEHAVDLKQVELRIVK